MRTKGLDLITSRGVRGGKKDERGGLLVGHLVVS
jgi:hypothetical protein